MSSLASSDFVAPEETGRSRRARRRLRAHAQSLENHLLLHSIGVHCLVFNRKNKRRQAKNAIGRPLVATQTFIALGELLLLLTCCSLVQESHSRPMSSFLDSGHPISCAANKPVHIGKIIPGIKRDLERCYSCTCPTGTVVCFRVSEAPECELPGRPAASAHANRGSATKQGRARNTGSPQASGCGSSAAANAATPPTGPGKGQARQAPHTPVAHPIGCGGMSGQHSATAGNISRRPMVRTVQGKPLLKSARHTATKPASAARGQQQQQHRRPAVGEEPDLEPQEDEEQEVVQERQRQQAAAAAKRLRHAEILRPTQLALDDPKHLQIAASAFGSEFVQKKNSLLQQIERRKSTATPSRTTTATPEPTTLEFTTMATVASTTPSEQLDETGDEDEQLPDLGADWEAREHDLLQELDSTQQQQQQQQPVSTTTTTSTVTTTTTTGAPTTIFASDETKDNNKLDANYREAGELMEQVSNEAMLYIAMAVEGTILLVILVMMLIIYVYRDRALDDELSTTSASTRAGASCDADEQPATITTNGSEDDDEDHLSSASSTLSSGALSQKHLTSFVSGYGHNHHHHHRHNQPLNRPLQISSSKEQTA